MGTHVITEECTCCSTCADACPMQAISDQGLIYAIDAELCTDCGACDEVCPIDAIVSEG